MRGPGRVRRLKDLARRLLLLAIGLLVRAGDGMGAVVRLHRSRPRPGSCTILYYHEVGPGQRRRFARQMDQLLRYARPVPADSKWPPHRCRRCAAVTFDDALAGLLHGALPELHQRGIPCTVFVPAGYLGRRPGWAFEPGREPAGEARVMSAGELARIAQLPGVRVGAHGDRHLPLTRLGDGEALAELRRSKSRLEAVLQGPVSLLSFPHGAHTARHVAMARSLGYERVFSILPDGSGDGRDGFLAGRVRADPQDWPTRVPAEAARRLPLAGRRVAPQGAAGKDVAMSERDQNGTRCEVDRVTKEQWHALIAGFLDATLYQTWSYGAVRWGEGKLSHLVVRRDGEVIGAAQVRIAAMPLLKRGIAYLPWGPMCRRRDRRQDPEDARRTVRALKEEYVLRRRLHLRVRCHGIEGRDDRVREAFTAEGFRCSHSPYRTILLDLSLAEKELRAGMSRTTRRTINRAERNTFELRCGTDGPLYARLLIPYREMVSRKRFVPGVDADEFGRVQEDLPEALKMEILVVEEGDRPVSSLLASGIGETGIGILGGCGDRGLSTGAFPLVLWTMIRRMRERGLRWCDLGGYDPERNPGTALLKHGFGGEDVRHVGQFDLSADGISGILVGAAHATRLLR